MIMAQNHHRRGHILKIVASDILTLSFPLSTMPVIL
uniref:Uncharacterized protein n=1 Tax=Anguilla anguilla TaxID=7936 RepID=A0A0E9PJ50_ANGAN